MSTRSTIALEFENGTVQQVYCHHDGYLDGVGATLTETYATPDIVSRLIELGDFSALEETVQDTRKTAYAYSKGEQLYVRNYQNINDYYDNCQREEYDYIMRPLNNTHCWFVRCKLTSGKWIPLQEVLEPHSDVEITPELTEQVKIIQARAYFEGLRDGVSQYAHWKEGVQYVGSTGKTLASALSDIDLAEKKELALKSAT